eukprot:8199600-Lingulodinium_polyedra.AAC.1
MDNPTWHAVWGKRALHRPRNPPRQTADVDLRRTGHRGGKRSRCKPRIPNACGSVATMPRTTVDH